MSGVKGLRYDAAPILGLGEASSNPLPDPAPGDVVIRVGAWSLDDLRVCEHVVRQRLIGDEDWEEDLPKLFPWFSAKLTPGVYRLRVPVPDSNRKTFSEQCQLLLPGEEVAPTTIVATTLIVHLMVAGQSLPNLPCGDVCRCAEPFKHDSRVGLYVTKNDVDIHHWWDDDRCDDIWLAASMKI